MYEIYQASYPTWVKGHLKLEENLKSKLWNLILMSLFLKYKNSELTMCYEFKLDKIPSYKHIGFADYASVVFSGKLNDVANVFFFGRSCKWPQNYQKKNLIKIGRKLLSNQRLLFFQLLVNFEIRLKF